MRRAPRHAGLGPAGLVLDDVSALCFEAEVGTLGTGSARRPGRNLKLCWEARLHTRAGRLPLVLWARPTRVGERLFVVCRAGICAEDFEAHIGELLAL